MIVYLSNHSVFFFCWIKRERAHVAIQLIFYLWPGHTNLTGLAMGGEDGKPASNRTFALHEYRNIILDVII